jgi:L-lactate dehydrogenase complex protein LldG
MLKPKNQKQVNQKNQQKNLKKMPESSRDQILNKISRVQDVQTGEYTETTYNQQDIYKPVLPDLLTCFVNELEAIAGKCIVADSEKDLFEKMAALMKEKELPFLFTDDAKLAELLMDNQINVVSSENIPEDMVAGITSCEFLIARTGSVMVSTADSSGRKMYAFPPVHFILANESQLLPYPQDALSALKKKYNNNLPSFISTITGPSRTADIEKTLVMGAHGPKELIIFVLRK